MERKWLNKFMLNRLHTFQHKLYIFFLLPWVFCNILNIWMRFLTIPASLPSSESRRHQNLCLILYSTPFLLVFGGGFGQDSVSQDSSPSKSFVLISKRMRICTGWKCKSDQIVPRSRHKINPGSTVVQRPWESHHSATIRPVESPVIKYYLLNKTFSFPFLAAPITDHYPYCFAVYALPDTSLPNYPGLGPIVQCTGFCILFRYLPDDSVSLILCVFGL